MNRIELWPRFVLEPYLRKKFGKRGSVSPR
jgi:hypothetical protein